MIGCVDFRRCNQAVHVKAQLIIQALLDRAAKQSGKDKAARDETKHAPDGSSGNQPERQ
jgi:hypothetical protein